MSEIALAAADLALVERLRERERIAAEAYHQQQQSYRDLENLYNAMTERAQHAESTLHTRNGELMVERMNLDMLRDDVRRAIALLPADPGAALGVLILAIHTQNVPVTPQDGPRETIEA